MKKDAVPLEIKYSGPDVDDGSMSVSDVVPALQGLASAYGKIAAEENLKVNHNIRVTGVRKGSFELILEVCTIADAASGPVIDGITFTAGVSATLVIKKLVGIIKLSKHIHRDNHSTKIEGDNNVVVTNSDNVNLIFPLSVYQMYNSGLIKNDLAKIVEPLDAGKIESASITVDSESEIIAYEDKRIFETEVVEAAKTQRMNLKGWFNSLTKSTNKGSFNLKDGSRVTYFLAIDEPELLYEHFIYKGPVEVDCQAHLDENLKPILLDIYDITPLQSDLGFSSDLDESRSE